MAALPSTTRSAASYSASMRGAPGRRLRACFCRRARAAVNRFTISATVSSSPSSAWRTAPSAAKKHPSMIASSLPPRHAWSSGSQEGRAAPVFFSSGSTATRKLSAHSLWPAPCEAFPSTP